MYRLPNFLDIPMILSISAGDNIPPLTKALIKSLFLVSIPQDADVQN
jgi:hypothetical protein